MDTLVSDPFYEAMPRHFGLPFKELLAAKHPTAWLEFEKGDISEEAMLSKFFKDGRPVDGPALTGMMGAHYRLLDGVEPLLDRLKQARVEMHACSNYPVWWRNVEKSVALSRWLAWTFVSCEGPMMVRGARGREAREGEAREAREAREGERERSRGFCSGQFGLSCLAPAFGRNKACRGRLSNFRI